MILRNLGRRHPLPSELGRRLQRRGGGNLHALAIRCRRHRQCDLRRALHGGINGPDLHSRGLHRSPDDYANVTDIPANFTFTPNSEGRYQVGRGEQITVVTGGASLPEGYTRFYLQLAPLDVWDALAGLGLPAHPAGGYDLHLHAHH